MKLMTPGQVSRMPKDDCILFIEGVVVLFMIKRTGRSIRKNLSRQKNWRVRMVYESCPGHRIMKKQDNIKHWKERKNSVSYRREEFAFFKEAEKTMNLIKTFEMDMQQFLYTNWQETPRPTEEEIRNMIRKISKKDISGMEPPADVYPLLEEEDYDRESEEEKPWDLSGSIFDCLLRYADRVISGGNGRDHWRYGRWIE